MTPEQRYKALKDWTLRAAMVIARGDRTLADELLSVADLAFAKALDTQHRKNRTLALDGWIKLNVQNDMLNFARLERLLQSRRILQDAEALDARPHKAARLDLVLDLSDEAALVAKVLSSVSGVTRRAFEESLEDARTLLYGALGWEGYWDAIDEIKSVMEGCS